MKYRLHEKLIVKTRERSSPAKNAENAGWCAKSNNPDAAKKTIVLTVSFNTAFAANFFLFKITAKSKKPIDRAGTVHLWGHVNTSQ